MSKAIQNRYTISKDASIASANTGEIIVCTDPNEPKLSILDSNKKRIDFKSSDKYLPLSGGTITGNVEISGSELNIQNGAINLNTESSLVVTGTSDITCDSGGTICINEDGDLQIVPVEGANAVSINKKLVTLHGNGDKVVLDNGSTKALSEISGGGSVSGDYLPLSGGTVTGKTTINSELHVNGDVFVYNGGGEVLLGDSNLNVNGNLDITGRTTFHPLTASTGTTLLVDENGIHPMSSGYFSVGTSGASFNNAYIQNINATKVNSSAGFFETSDENLKTIIKPLENDFEKLAQLRKVHFYFKKDETKREQIGVIAQDIEKIYPEIVSRDENKNLTVDYSKLSVIALNAVDKLYELNKNLEERLNNIEEKIKNL